MKPATVAAAAAAEDQELGGLGITRLTEALPPAFDGGGGEFGGVVVDPDAHPTFVGGQILDAVGDGLAQLFIHEVVDANLFGVAGGSATRGPRF